MENENPIDEAKEQVEEALENLERVEIEQKIDNAESTAHIAVEIANDVSNESREAIENITQELINHEENDEWQRQRIHELMIQMGSLQDELSILKASQNPVAERVMEIEQTPITDQAEPTVPETTISPEMQTETSLETKTELPNENADENPEPVLQTVLNPHRKIRLV